jgi:ribose transport system substrate-binding protein
MALCASSWEEHMSYVKALVLSGASAVALLGMSPAVMAEGGLRCEPGETYVMNVMVSGHPYWVPVFEGFKQAAAALGCEAVFSGTPDYDITKQIASFEQDLVKNPKGILLHPMQADPFIDPINRAIDAGVSVTTFAADSPKSKRTAYITSDNLAEAAFAAEEIVKTVGDSAEYAVLENPGQSNHDLRVTALIAYMEKNYPNMKLVGRQATNQDPNAAFTAVSAMLQANPDLAALWIPESGSAEGAVAAVKAAGDTLMIVHADISPTTLEEIKAGNIHMALNPNQGIQGFIGFMNTFLGAQPGLIDPFNDYKTSGYNPMQIPFVDNGFAVITKDNADSFVLEAYMEGRN